MIVICYSSRAWRQEWSVTEESPVIVGVKRKFCRRLYKYPSLSATLNMETFMCEEAWVVMQCVWCGPSRRSRYVHSGAIDIGTVLWCGGRGRGEAAASGRYPSALRQPLFRCNHYFCFWRDSPPGGQGLLIHKVSTSHTTTHHSQ